MRLGRTTCRMPKLHLTTDLVSTEISMSVARIGDGGRLEVEPLLEPFAPIDQPFRQAAAEPRDAANLFLIDLGRRLHAPGPQHGDARGADIKEARALDTELSEICEPLLHFRNRLGERLQPSRALDAKGIDLGLEP